MTKTLARTDLEFGAVDELMEVCEAKEWGGPRANETARSWAGGSGDTKGCA